MKECYARIARYTRTHTELERLVENAPLFPTRKGHTQLLSLETFRATSNTHECYTLIPRVTPVAIFDTSAKKACLRGHIDLTSRTWPFLSWKARDIGRESVSTSWASPPGCRRKQRLPPPSSSQSAALTRQHESITSAPVRPQG